MAVTYLLVVRATAAKDLAINRYIWSMVGIDCLILITLGVGPSVGNSQTNS